MNFLTRYFDLLVNGYTRQLIRHRWLALILTLLVSVLLSWQANHLRVEADYKYYFSGHNVLLESYEDIEATYSKLDSTIFAIQAQNGETIASPRILQLTYELTERLWDMPHTGRVDSITNYQHTTAEGDTLYVEDLLEDPEGLDEQQAQTIIEIASSKPEINRFLISRDNNVLAVVATANVEKGDNQGLTDIFNYSNDVLQEFQQRYPDVKFVMGGFVPRGYTFYIAPTEDMKVLIPVMFGLLIVIMWWLTRTISAPLITLGLVSLASSIAMGVGAMLDIPLTTISSSAPVIVLTVAVADAIHIIIGYLLALNKGMSREEAVLKSMVLNAKPVLLTTVTTAIGFLSLNFSDSPPYRDLGNLAAIGVAAAWILSMVYLPAMLMIVPMKANPIIDRQTKGISGVTRLLLRFRLPLFVTAIALTLFALVQLPKLTFNDDFTNTFDRKRVDTDINLQFLADNLAGMFQLNMSVPAAGENGVADPEYLHLLEKFEVWLADQPEVQHVNSVVPIFKNLNKSMNADDDSYYRIADNRELNAQYLLLYEMSLPYGLDITNRINSDKSASRLDVSTGNLKSQEFLAFSERVDQWVVDNFPAHMQAVGTGGTRLYSELGIKNFESMEVATVVAFILISVCIGLSLGSLRLGMVSLLPNTIPLIIVAGFFYLGGGELGAWTPFVVSTAFGLIVDATVHLLSKYNYARKEYQLDPEASIDYAFSTVGVALWVSTLVLVVGFSTLFFAVVIMLKYLGVGTALTVLIALILNVMVLPVLLIQAE